MGAACEKTRSTPLAFTGTHTMHGMEATKQHAQALHASVLAKHAHGGQFRRSNTIELCMTLLAVLCLALLPLIGPTTTTTIATGVWRYAAVL